MTSITRTLLAATALCTAAGTTCLAATVHLTERADTYIAKFGDWDIHGRGGNDRITDSGALKAPDHYAPRALYGEGGNDTLRGVFLYGGAGNDKLTVTACVDDEGCLAWGEAGNDVLTTEFRDGACSYEVELNGGPGNDKLVIAAASGGAFCASRLIGGAGRDVMHGHALARDRFIFYGGQSPRGAGHDIVRYFTKGQDVIDLAAGDANLGQPGDQAYILDPTPGRNPGIGHVSQYQTGASTWFVANNGGPVLLEVEIQGLNAPLDAADFAL